MEKYEFGDNTLLHSIGFDIYKLNSILKTGIVSKNQAEKENILYAKNNFGYNFDDYISMIRYMYVNEEDETSAYKKYVEKGISFIVEDQNFIYNKDEMYFNHADEVFVKDKITIDNIKGIMVPEKFLNYEIKDLPMLPLASTSYINIKHTTDNIIRYLKNEGHSCDLEYYNDILREMYETLNALQKEPNDEDLLNDFKESKYDLDYYISNEVGKCFSKKFNKEVVTLGNILDYINEKTLDLPVYKTSSNYNVR